MERISRKYRNIVVFFGDEVIETQGTTKITKNIFAGTQDRKENAIVFLENLSKIKQNTENKRLGKGRLTKENLDLNTSFDTNNQTNDYELSTLNGKKRYNSQSGFDEVESLEPIEEAKLEQSTLQEEDVLLNMSSANFEKPKD